METWYAVQTKPGTEARVQVALEARALHTFLPMIPQSPHHQSHPLFPGYLFLRCDFDRITTASLQWIVDLRCLVVFGSRPAIVPDEAIVVMQTQLAAIAAQGGLPDRLFKPDDPVEVGDGLLMGLQVVFQGPMKSADRVRVLEHFLGRADQIELPVAALRPASSNGQRKLRRRRTRGRGRRIRYLDDAPA